MHLEWDDQIYVDRLQNKLLVVSREYVREILLLEDYSATATL